MQSAPVSDSLEGPKRRNATGDAIFGDRFFPSICPAPPFRPWTQAGPKTFFRKPPRHRAAPIHIVSGGASVPNSSRFGAFAAGEAVTIVHDVRYVT